MNEMPVVVFSNVAKTFTKGGTAFTACSGLSFDVRRGEVVAIVGETGCGKSTALPLLLGLAERILVFGKPGRVVAEINARDMLASGRTHLEIVRRYERA